MTATLIPAVTDTFPPSTGLPQQTEAVDPTALPEVGSHSVASQQPGVHATPIDAERLLRAKKAYTTRFVAERLASSASGLQLISGAEVAPRAGQVVLARIVSLGQHKKLPDAAGRRQTLYPGDEILLAYGDRYAPDQFEAEVPGSLALTNLAAAGGLAAHVTDRHGSTSEATLIEPLGLLARGDGSIVTLRDVAPRAVRPTAELASERRADGPPVVYVFGSSMNAGKTTAVANVVRGLSLAGLRVAAGKATGTGAWGDPGLFLDSGASTVLDFTDFGYGSTFRIGLEEAADLVASVRHELSQGNPDVVVIEIADGLYQRETSHLIRSGALGDDVHAVVLAVGEALGAVTGVAELRSAGLPVAGVSGAITASPMASREADDVIDLPLVDTFSLSEPATVREFLGL
ncbi:DUF1611 domain-containing protein [Kytococcus sedentarius]|uniref:DUF1611 domain-containing protein n=1 Tax=Kytococcus sedentarius TaxID=1276 RepID=UPI0035BC3B40